MDLPNRTNIESAFSKEFNSLSLQHKRELKLLLGDPPNPANVPQEFWDRVRREEENLLTLALFAVFVASADQHGSRFGLSQSAIHSAGVDWANKRAKVVAEARERTSKELLETAQVEWETERRKIREVANKEMLITGVPPEPKPDPVRKKDINDRIDKVFGKSRVEATVVNEVTNVATDASEFAIKSVGRENPKDTWFTERDDAVCPICRPLHRMYRSFTDGTHPITWEGKFPNGPPAHIHCRCHISYVADREAAFEARGRKPSAFVLSRVKSRKAGIGKRKEGLNRVKAKLRRLVRLSNVSPNGVRTPRMIESENSIESENLAQPAPNGIAKLDGGPNCGIGSDGFEAGNDCASGGGGGDLSNRFIERKGESKTYTEQIEVGNVASRFSDKMRDEELGIVGTVGKAKSTNSVYATFFFANGDEEKRETLVNTPDFLRGGLKTMYTPDLVVRISDHAEGRGSRNPVTHYFDIMQPASKEEIDRILNTEVRDKIKQMTSAKRRPAQKNSRNSTNLPRQIILKRLRKLVGNKFNFDKVFHTSGPANHKTPTEIRTPG